MAAKRCTSRASKYFCNVKEETAVEAAPAASAAPALNPGDGNALSHNFDNEKEVTSIRRCLLDWYDSQKRDLPWRHKGQANADTRAYQVLVSEVMLQQTRVATVLPYYLTWMERWPDTATLATASIDDVHRVWSGLGYYSRATRLHQAARKIEYEMEGAVPRTAELLRQRLPGVGAYTAGAVASIAFGQATPAVDGNVVRVLSRLRAIGADVARKTTTDLIWRLADRLVDPERPGDFNQSLMELGATVCTPRTADCQRCPVRGHCLALGRTLSDTKPTVDTGHAPSGHLRDEADCGWCLPVDGEGSWRVASGVANYPRKAPKAAPRLARDLVLVVESERRDADASRYLLCRRPATGLLADLWEFPSWPHPHSDDASEDPSNDPEVVRRLIGDAGVDVEDVRFVADVEHRFSHIRQTYTVFSCRTPNLAELKLPAHYRAFDWLDGSAIDGAAISTAMRKVWRSATTATHRGGRKRARPHGQ